jgi:Na+/melibiose symporter-like transporter
MHPSLEGALKETLGVILYQEQVLRVAHDLAGMSYAEADGFRRAMTHDSTHDEMNKMRLSFLYSAIKKGVRREVAEEVFEQLAASLMLLFFFGHTQGMNFTLVMMVFLGIGIGFTYAPPYAMVADAIEYDYLRTGERREGAFFGIWTWGLKIGQALAVFLMGVTLEAMGYVANAMPQAASAQLGIRLFLGPISAAIFILAAVVLYFYPITEKRYKEILAEIAERDAKKA